MLTRVMWHSIVDFRFLIVDLVGGNYLANGFGFQGEAAFDIYFCDVNGV